MPNYISTFPTKTTPRVLTSPGDYRVLDFQLEGSSGTLSIPEKLLGFTIYENLHNPFLTAELLIVDTNNLPSTLPIEGGEKISITILDCLGIERTHRFRVTKVTDRIPSSPSSLTYTIHASSEVVVRSHSNALSRSVINELAEDQIEKILRDIGHDKPLNSSETSQELCFMIPNWRPLKAISWISRISVSKQFSDSPFVTFMTIDEDVFHLPLDLLYSSESSGRLIWRSNKSSVDGNLRLNNDPRMDEHLFAFLDFQVINTSNVLENLSTGMFKTRTQIVDLFERKEEDEFYDYSEDFVSSVHLGTRPISMHDVEVGNDSYWRTIFRHNGHFSQESEESRYEVYAAKHNSKRQQMKNFVIQGKLPGHTQLTVGQKYDVRIPRFSNSSNYQDEDNYLSGQFITEAIKHDFYPNNQYVCTVRAFKDAAS